MLYTEDIPQVGNFMGVPQARRLPLFIRYAVVDPFQKGPERWESAKVIQCADELDDIDPNDPMLTGRTLCERNEEGYWQPIE